MTEEQEPNDGQPAAEGPPLLTQQIVPTSIDVASGNVGGIGEAVLVVLNIPHAQATVIVSGRNAITTGEALIEQGKRTESGLALAAPGDVAKIAKATKGLAGSRRG